MRIKVTGLIIENNDVNKTNYNHEVYSMILSNLNIERAKRIHTKTKFKRLFTFTQPYINNDKVHFYLAGEEELIKDFINGIIRNQLIKIGGKVINIISVNELDNKVKVKEEYYFKSKFIVNEMENGKVCLSNNKKYIEERINRIAKDKYKDLYNEEIKDNLSVEILSMNRKFNKYKNHHINCYDSVVKIKGNNKLVNVIYNVGMGENTASGHGFMWEV